MLTAIWAEKSKDVPMFHSCVAKFLFEMWICKTFEIYPCEEQRRMYLVILIFASVCTCLDHKRETKGFLVEWILQTCLRSRLRLNHHWVLATLTLFTNRNQIYCSRDQKNAAYHERIWNRFHFHWGWSSYIHESTWSNVCIEK